MNAAQCYALAYRQPVLHYDGANHLPALFLKILPNLEAALIQNEKTRKIEIVHQHELREICQAPVNPCVNEPPRGPENI